MSGSSGLALRSLPYVCLVIATALVLAGGVAAATTPLSADEPGSSAGSESAHLGAETWTAMSYNESTAIESNTTFTVEIQTSGDARWTITERFNISTVEQQQQFEDLAAEFESNTADGSNLGFDSFERASELVDEETVRDMSITDPQRTSSVDGDVGTLTLSFTWENFARSDGNRLVLDDVYETEHGVWFPGLTEHQELVIRSPDGFGFDDANVIPEQGQLVWEGPQTFTNETLHAVLIGNGGSNATTTPDVSPTPTPTPGSGSSGIGSSIGLMALVLGGVGVLGVVAVIAVMAVGTERVQTLLTRAGTREEDDTVEKTSVAGTQVTEGGDDAGESDSEIDLELLSDEERVERLLEQNGGRMKQATIVKETGWSNAKVSQLLSAMEEDDRINKLRIGRENLISFPEEDITEIGDK